MSKEVISADIKIQDKISDYNKIIFCLQELLSDKKRELLDLRINELKNSEYQFVLYKDGFTYRYLGILPYFKNKYKVMEERYRSAFEKFRQQICANLSILDDFCRFDGIRKRLDLRNSSECFVNSGYILPYELCVKILEDYYHELNDLLEKSKNELSLMKDSMIETWGGKLLADVVSSLKVVVKVFNLSEVEYKSLVELYNKTSNDLKTLKMEDEDIISKRNEISENFSYLKKLSRESFVDHNENACRELYTHLKNVSNTDSKMTTLNFEQERVESKRDYLSSVVFHLKTALDGVPTDFPTLNFDNTAYKKLIEPKYQSDCLKEKLNGKHLESIKSNLVFPVYCNNDMKHTSLI